ncbi:hypothetical protein F66182_11374 [Fusarium sp. NRRL 66182]|nr:hypothetical protein F66182_11374 [Fusarium sp. NRRL 66182]
MCNAGVTPNSHASLREDQELGKNLWARSSLDCRYDYNFKKVLKKKYLDRAKSLLLEIAKFGAFNKRQNGEATVYLWNTSIVDEHFGSARSIKIWLEMSRAQARARHSEATVQTPRRRDRTTRPTFGTPQTPPTWRTSFILPSTPTSASSAIDDAMQELRIGAKRVGTIQSIMNGPSSPTSPPSPVFPRTGLAFGDGSLPNSPLTRRTPVNRRPPTSEAWNLTPVPLNFNSMDSPAWRVNEPAIISTSQQMQLLQQQLGQHPHSEQQQRPGGLLPINYQMTLPPSSPPSITPSMPPPVPFATRPLPPETDPKLEDARPRISVRFGYAGHVPLSSSRFTTYRNAFVEDEPGDEDDKMMDVDG